MRTFHGQNCYFAPAPTNDLANSNPTASKIIYLSDGFGLALVNNKILADHYAREIGVDVIAPDVPPGGGLNIKALELTDHLTDPNPWWNLFGWLSKVWTGLRLVVVAMPFILNKNKREKSRLEMIELGRALKSDMALAGNGGKLGVAGFCYGGWLAVKLCNTSLVEDGKESTVDAAFAAHPSWLDTPTEILDVVKKGVPLSLALSDKDLTLKMEKVEEIEVALREQIGKGEENDYEVEVYRGNIPHGFAVRAREGVKVQIDAANKAAEQAISWFKQYLR